MQYQTCIWPLVFSPSHFPIINVRFHMNRSTQPYKGHSVLLYSLAKYDMI